MAGVLGGTAGCETGGQGPNVELFTSLSDFNNFLEGIGMAPVVGTGGVLTIGGITIGWGEIGAGVATLASPEVVISIAAIAGAVALYNYYEAVQSRRLYNAIAYCSVHQDGTPDHASAGTVTGQGQGTSAALAIRAAFSDAQANVFAQYGIGFHAQHCHYKVSN